MTPQINWCPTMLRQVPRPAAPTPKHPEMKPVDVDRVIAWTSQRGQLRDDQE